MALTLLDRWIAALPVYGDPRIAAYRRHPQTGEWEDLRLVSAQERIDRHCAEMGMPPRRLIRDEQGHYHAVTRANEKEQ
jgi:hypothetical protein